MLLSPFKMLAPSISGHSRLPIPHQLSIAFESPGLQDLTSVERTAVVERLASLLLQAAGQAAGSDDGEL